MFAKVFEQIFDSSIAADYNVRHMFMDLLVLADKEGVVDMTYDAISRRTNVPIEKVVQCIGELMSPDPSSRSKRNEGARLSLLDGHRDWGWKIVNYDHYRSLRDEESRRSYFRDKMRESRQRRRGVKNVKEPAGESDQTGTDVDGVKASADLLKIVKEQSPPTEEISLNRVKHSQTELTRLTHAEAEGEAEKPSLRSLPQPQPPPPTVRDPVEAKRLICSKIFPGMPAGQLWSRDAEDGLARRCKEEGGIPRQEIDDIAWFQQYRRETLTPTTLMVYWPDEARRALVERRKLAGGNGVSAKEKEEPPRWREFLQWKHDNPNVSLPKSFWFLSRDHQAEYWEHFQTFVNCVPEPEGAPA